MDASTDRPTVGGTLTIEPGDGVLRPMKASEAVAREIVRQIVERKMRTGDRLPPEGVMLGQHGVSRETLREGLRLLEVQGLIVIRRGAGGGPVVGTVDPANLGRTSALYYHLAGATYRELYEAWILAETLLAEHAARNPDGGARSLTMTRYMREHAGHAGPLTLSEFVQVHARFHGALATLVRNRVLELSFQTMGLLVSHHVAIGDDPRLFRQVIEDDHRGIAEAVVAGHSRRARTLMGEHIGHMTRSAEAVLGDVFDDLIEWQ
jgi:GntR family transcriptional repressor for pyruvate dehydrogenase complex